MLEGTLKTIKDSKLDNELLCADNNNDIAKYEYIIEEKEKELEAELKTSGEKKLECKMGWCSYRAMPDKFNYDIPKLINWAKQDEERQERYVKVVEEFKKAQLKKDYAEGLPYSDDVCNEGLTITPQEPKFNYKLNGGL